MANRLFDRRDITAEREAQFTGEQSDPIVPPVDNVTPHLRTTNELLREIARQERADLTQLCVSDNDPPEPIIRNFPAKGTQRFIVRRTGTGGTRNVAQNVATLVATASESRIGGHVVNSGSNAVRLYLTDNTSPNPVGVPVVYLAAGAVWDFRLGAVLWCGNITAICTVAGGTTVDVAEV